MFKNRFYIGTHASGDRPSIYLCEADFKEGSFTTIHTMQGISDPTYLTVSPRDTLYALGKSSDSGRVCALKRESAQSPEGLTALNARSSGGTGPCHISVDERGAFLLCANYASGSVSLYDLNSDGRILSLCDFRQYSGVGFDSEDRQRGPHAHYAAFYSKSCGAPCSAASDPDQLDARDEVLVCDLGLDMVYVYELDRTARKLRDTDRSIRLPDGTGPRHLTFSKEHPGMLFVLTEMANTIFTYKYDPDRCKYVLVQRISAVEEASLEEALMVPPTADHGSIGCAIRFTNDGRYLFVSSRLGYQSISSFRCDTDGRLSFADRCLCGGTTPRDFNVFESGETASDSSGSVFLLVANQDSDLITALQFDRHSEKLSLLDMKMQAEKPTCILPV